MRPLCECHGVPMVLSGTYGSGTIRYRCRVKKAAKGRKWYLLHREETLARTNGRKQRLRDDGVCIECGQDVALGVRCFDCMRVNDESKIP